MNNKKVLLYLTVAMIFGLPLHAETKDCCKSECPQGAPGRTGPQGPQGTPGLAGDVGTEGSQGNQGSQGFGGIAGPAGPAGPQGPQGAEGIAGPQGPRGEVGPCGLPNFAVYANLFSNVNQVITKLGTPGDTVMFESSNAVSASNFDISSTAATGEIIFLESGIYLIEISLEATLTVFAFPEPLWSFGLYLNDTILLDSFASYTFSPVITLTHTQGEVTVQIDAGQRLSLKNTCANTVKLVGSPFGTLVPNTSASINIRQLRPL